MRVFVLTSSFPRSPTDVAGKFVWEWCEVLRRAGHEVRVYTWGRASAWQPPGIEVRRLAYLPRRMQHLFEMGGAPDVLEREPWRLVEAPMAAARMIVGALGRDVPDLWVGHWLLPAGLLARSCGGLTRRPSLVVGHSAGIHALQGLSAPLRGVLGRLIVRAGSTTAPSAALAAKLHAKVEILPMGFNAPGDPPDENARGVLLFGRLQAIKGFDVALGQLAELDLQIHVAGDGPERASLEALAPRATFHGFIDRVGQAALFPRCDVACFPSRVLRSGRHEGWPVSVHEVASMGVIPVVSDWPGAAEMVVRPDLQVVRAEDDSGYRRAVDRLHGLPNAELVSLRACTIEHARRYTWDALGPRWLELVVNL